MQLKVVLLKAPELEQAEARIKELQEALYLAKRERNDLERKYCDEVYINNALCDLLTENGIKYRDTMRRSVRNRAFSSNKRNSLSR